MTTTENLKLEQIRISKDLYSQISLLESLHSSHKARLDCEKSYPQLPSELDLRSLQEWAECILQQREWLVK